MQLGPCLRRAFFERPCLQVAPDLIGAILVRTLPSGFRLLGRIVDVEAYLGDGRDPASHSHRGPTPRNRSMFGPPGRLYAYRSYGIHTCVNLVCEPEGSGAAVLLRAVEPLAGFAEMRRLRGLPRDRADRLLANGPGKLAQALDLDLSWDGASVLRGPVQVRGPRTGAPRPDIGRSGRVGISKGTRLAYRFFERRSPWTGPAPRATTAGRAAPAGADS
ncbi:MAG: DNA-3-methyladenine glycosylase [Proteobacteria bacterium]|nr:DNA-3-methyladenine glycosylase [Pseudomonadota bacterium]